MYNNQQPKKNSKPLTSKEIKVSSNNVGGKNQVRQASNQAQNELNTLLIGNTPKKFIYYFFNRLRYNIYNDT